MSNLTNIMSLNEDGLNAFRALLTKRRGNEFSAIKDIAFDEQLVNETHYKTKIDLDRKFIDRYDIAKYLHNIMHNEYIKNKDQYDQDIGLWSWIALVIKYLLVLVMKFLLTLIMYSIFVLGGGTDTVSSDHIIYLSVMEITQDYIYQET